jgi:hypothetical protein
MAANESTDPRVIAAGLEAYRVAKQREFAERAEQRRPNTEVQRQARAVLVAGIPPATKPEKD